MKRHSLHYSRGPHHCPGLLPPLHLSGGSRLGGWPRPPGKPPGEGGAGRVGVAAGAASRIRAVCPGGGGGVLLCCLAPPSSAASALSLGARPVPGLGLLPSTERGHPSQGSPKASWSTPLPRRPPLLGAPSSPPTLSVPDLGDSIPRPVPGGLCSVLPMRSLSSQGGGGGRSMTSWVGTPGPRAETPSLNRGCCRGRWPVSPGWAGSSGPLREGSPAPTWALPFSLPIGTSWLLAKGKTRRLTPFPPSDRCRLSGLGK